MRPHGLYWWVFFLILPLGPLGAQAKFNATSRDRIPYLNVAPGEFANAEERRVQEETFSVRLEFRSRSRKPYGGVFIRLYNADGIEIFEQLCEKPWLYLRLNPGNYHVIAVDRKKVQRIAPFSIREGRLQRVTLRWPIEAVGY